MTAQPNLEAVERLEALARAATPGPWKACGTIYEHMNCEVRSGVKGEGQGIAQVWDGPNAFKDGQFIAAANPETILGLISTIRSQADALKLADNAIGCVTAFESDARYIMGNTNFEIVKHARDEVRKARAALTPEVKP